MSRCKALVAAGIVSLATATASQAAVMIVNFRVADPSGQGPYNGAPLNGLYFNNYGTKTSDVLTLPQFQLKDTANGNSGITLESPNFGGFISDDRGNGVDHTYSDPTFGTFTFPGGFMNSYIADNMSTSGTSHRDGLLVLRLTSDTQYSFKFIIGSSFHHGSGIVDGTAPATGVADGGQMLVNIGGVYNRTRSNTTGSFTGGTTVSLDPSGNGTRDQGAVGVAGQSVWDASLGKYVLDLQLGEGATGDGVYINAMRIETSPVPEPTAVAAIGLLAGGLVLRRRRH